MPRGGKRPGAGRPKGSIDRATAIKRAKPTLEAITGTAANEAVSAAAILQTADEMRQWLDLLNSESDSVRLETMKYLTDRRDGRPKQALQVDAKVGAQDAPPVIHVHFTRQCDRCGKRHEKNSPCIQADERADEGADEGNNP